MATSTTSGGRDPVEALAEEFLDRRRRGEPATPEEYAEAHPELAEEILVLFPALLMMEDLAGDSDGQTGSLTNGAATVAGATAGRLGEYGGTIRELPVVVDSTGHPFRLTLAHLFLAMAHQRLGHGAEARRELNAERESYATLGRSGWRDSARGDLMSFGWTEWVIATVVLCEAEGLIVYDPVFPADPFAR